MDIELAMDLYRLLLLGKPTAERCKELVGQLCEACSAIPRPDGVDDPAYQTWKANPDPRSVG